MSRVKTLEAAMNRVPAAAGFVVRAVLRGDRTDEGDEDGALWLEIVTVSRRDCVRVRHSDGEGVCLGFIGFQECLLSLQEKVAVKLNNWGYAVDQPIIDPVSAHAYNGVVLLRGRKRPTAANWFFD